MRTASSMSTARSSFESSLSVLGPPLDRITTPFGNVDGMLERRMPRVHIRASAYWSSGTMVRSMRSSPVVGPRK